MGRQMEMRRKIEQENIKGDGNGVRGENGWKMWRKI
jgi:hypothetical protein